MIDSYIMLGLSLETDIDFVAVFEDDDLVVPPGIERNTCLEVLHIPDYEISKDGLKDKLSTILGKEDWARLMKKFRAQKPRTTLDYFSLGKIEDTENDCDRIVLQLHEESPIYDPLLVLHTGLINDLNSDTAVTEEQKYVPNVTLAVLKPGRAANYMFNPTLNMVLQNSTFTLDDFILQHKKITESKSDFCDDVYITSENAVSRYFRQKRLLEDKEYYDSESK